jgi:Domain of unknown function (DUF397)
VNHVSASAEATAGELAGAAWRVSSRSGNGSGNCVEVAVGPDLVAVRDSTDRTGPVLRFAPGTWARFTAATRAGRFTR